MIKGYVRPFSLGLRSFSTVQKSMGNTQSTAKQTKTFTKSSVPQNLPPPSTRQTDGAKPQYTPLVRRLLHIRNVSHTTINGKMRQTYAMVIVGDRNGHAGYGEGRSTDFNIAVKKAEEQAMKTMVSIDRLDNRTLYSDIEETVNSTTIKLYAACPGYGISANNNVNEIAQCFGISDLAAKVHGSSNPMNVVKATFKALAKAKLPDEIAQVRGRKVSEVTSTYFGVPYMNRKSKSL